MAIVWIPAERCWTKTVIKVDCGAFLGVLALIMTMYFAHILLTGLVLWVFETVVKFST